MNKFIAWLVGSCLLVLTLTFWFNQPQNSGAGSHYAQDMAIAHQQDQPVASPMAQTSPQQPVTGELVNYGQIDGKPLSGYLSRPQNYTKSLPALIVIHEWWGLNDNIKMMSDRLAGEGYTALAVDLYRGEVAQGREQAKKLITKAIANSEELRQNIRQAYNYLENQAQAPKIGSIGWCFGGLWSLNTALLFPEQLDATVIYYGGNIETDSAKLAPLTMPILGIFAALDRNPPVELVKEFEANLKALNKSVDIHIYEGVKHAFANPSGENYNQEAAEDAWQKTTAFLARNLGSESKSE